MIKMQKAGEPLFFVARGYALHSFIWSVRSGDGISITKSDLGKAKSGPPPPPPPPCAEIVRVRRRESEL